MHLDLHAWLTLVSQIAPIALLATPLAPLAPFIIMGIQAAQQIPGATGSQKLQIASQIAQIGIQATNAQAGKVLVDPTLSSEVIASGINTVVAAVKLKGTFKPQMPIVVPDIVPDAIPHP